MSYQSVPQDDNHLNYHHHSKILQQQQNPETNGQTFPTMAKTDEPSVRYQTQNHIAVILQMYASIWGQVLPYCIGMILLTITIIYTGKADLLDLRINDKGHTFMSVMVSFLIISRSHVSMVRYMEARHLIGELMRTSRELLQHTICFTRYEQGKKAQKWRADIARRACSLLRTVVVVLQHNSKREFVWQVSELSKAEKQALLLAVGGSNERSPLVLSIFIRTAISSHIECLHTPLDVNYELQLLSYTSEFLTAYHGLMKLITTPYPFPMIQMARTFLFVWVFTLPFALANDISAVVPLLFVVFFCTYGFIGLELISMALEDPFGTDPNDFDVKALAEVVYNDIYVMIEDIDGKEASNALRKSVEMPLQEQIKCAVKSHQPYTRLKHWSGKKTPSKQDHLTAKLDKFIRSSSTSSPIYSNNNNGIGSSPHDISWNDSFNSSFLNHRSKLLLSVHSHDSDTTIDIFGTNDGARFNSTEGTVTFKTKRIDGTDEEEILSRHRDEKLAMNERHLLETARHSFNHGSSKYSTQESEMISINNQYPFSRNDSINYSFPDDDTHLDSSDQSSLFEENYSFKSTLLSSVRQRIDTDASIEVFGSNQKVTFDPLSNTILVKTNHDRRKSILLTKGLVDESEPKYDFHVDQTNISYEFPALQSIGKEDMKGRVIETGNGNTSPLAVIHPNKSLSRRPPKLPRQSTLSLRRESSDRDIEK